MASVQVKRDLASGELHCNENTAALMASYIVQGENCLSNSRLRLCAPLTGLPPSHLPYLCLFPFIHLRGPTTVSPRPVKITFSPAPRIHKYLYFMHPICLYFSSFCIYFTILTVISPYICSFSFIISSFSIEIISNVFIPTLGV
jgi:hypothetical protein